MCSSILPGLSKWLHNPCRLGVPRVGRNPSGGITPTGVSRVESNDVAVGSCGQHFPSGAFGTYGQARWPSSGPLATNPAVAGGLLRGLEALLRPWTHRAGPPMSLTLTFLRFMEILDLLPVCWLR